MTEAAFESVSLQLHYVRPWNGMTNSWGEAPEAHSWVLIIVCI